MRPRSFGAKLVLLTTLTSGAAVILVCAVLITIDFYRFKDLAINQLIGHAQVTATHSAAAVDFDDQEAATEMLAALSQVPEIAWARLIKHGPTLLATYERATDPAPDFALPPVGQYEHGRWLVVSEPVVRRGEDLGRLVLVYDLSPIYYRSALNALISLGIGVLATAVAFALAAWLHRMLAGPLAELAATARTVSTTGDFSIRAAKYSDDELGQLTDAFNSMLSQLMLRDERLAQFREELAASNRQLVARNEEMEQFLYTASHDLKSPVVTIVGFLSMLREDLKANNQEMIQDALGHMEKSSARMIRLIDDLLQISRIGRMPLRPEEVDVATLVHELTGALGVQLQEAGATVEVKTDMPRVYIDRLRLSQVFENLLTNAVKYGCRGPDARIEIGAERDEKEVRFYVRDFGPGIAPQHHQRIFELFQRLDRDERGSGVGLTAVARIAQVHGGRVWVQSEPGQGATFWFALPAELLRGAPRTVAKAPAWEKDPFSSSSSKTTTAMP